MKGNVFIEEYKNDKMPKGFEIVNVNDLYIDLSAYAKEGALRGKYLGFPNLHELYTMSKPGVTDWTGFPQSGKTQVLMEALLNTSVFYDWKHLVYFPDVGNPKEIVADLIHKISGKTFDKRFPNHITDMEIAQHIAFVHEHFFILTKNDLKAKLTPYEFYDLGVEMKQTHGISTMSVDAWKDLRHDTAGFARDDKYLEDVLSYRNAIADEYKLHIHTIIHPKTLKTDKDGSRKPPTPYDLKGGSEWYNNGRNMITVHRNSGDKNRVEIYVNKIKPRSIGKVGVCELFFDKTKFRYYFDNAGTPTYAKKEYEEPKQIEFEQSIEVNDDLPF